MTAEITIPHSQWKSANDFMIRTDWWIESVSVSGEMIGYKKQLKNLIDVIKERPCEKWDFEKKKNFLYYSLALLHYFFWYE